VIIGLVYFTKLLSQYRPILKSSFFYADIRCAWLHVNINEVYINKKPLVA